MSYRVFSGGDLGAMVDKKQKEERKKKGNLSNLSNLKDSF